MTGPFRDREHMLNCLLDEMLKTRKPGETAGQFAARLSPPDLQALYWQRKIREYANANGYDVDAHGPVTQLAAESDEDRGPITFYRDANRPVEVGMPVYDADGQVVAHVVKVADDGTITIRARKPEAAS